MNKKIVLGNTFFKVLFAVLFISLAVGSVTDNGWNIFAIILIIFATFDITNAIKLLRIQKHINDYFKK